MKTIVTIAAAAGLIALGACSQSATENKADAIEANAENTADVMEANASNAADAITDNAENAAEATRNAGENAAEAVRNNSRPLSRPAQPLHEGAPRGALFSWARRRDSDAAMKRAPPRSSPHRPSCRPARSPKRGCAPASSMPACRRRSPPAWPSGWSTGCR